MNYNSCRHFDKVMRMKTNQRPALRSHAKTAGAITGVNSYNNVYEVEANYAGGTFSSPALSSLFQSATPPAAPNLNVTAQLVRNQTGRWQLMFSGITSNMQAIALDWYYWDYWYDIGPFPAPDWGYPFSVETDIPVSSLTNGVYVIPDEMIIRAILLGNANGNFGGWSVEVGVAVIVQPITTNGAYGNQIMAGFLPNDQPAFADGRQCLKQNMLFALRGAGINQPNAALGIPVDTNYVESSFFHWAAMNKGYNGDYAIYLAMDDLWPFEANYSLHPNLYDPNYTGPASFTWQGNLLTSPAPAVLGVSDPYWIAQPFNIYVGVGTVDPITGLPVPPTNTYFISPDTAAYTNNGLLYLQSGVHNLFGLAFEPALVNPGGPDWYGNVLVTNPIITLAPGGSIALTNVGCFYSQTADPGLKLLNYYFAPVNTSGTSVSDENPINQPTPIPSLTGFANTNQTGMLITSVGTPTLIGGWAKFAITNGSSSKFAYLGQYFATNAFVISNGVVTTNTTGIVSPYGDFFPTQAGAVAMVTMPDINTGSQGTGVVRVISLCADANHDGIMDTSYAGPDFVSASKPLRFWCANDNNVGDYGGNGVPGELSGFKSDVGFFNQGAPDRTVQGRKDLEDFFPVYLNIGSLFQSNALSVGINPSDSSWRFVLSQSDGALSFVYTTLTPTNYVNYLLDTNVSATLAGAEMYHLYGDGSLYLGFLGSLGGYFANGQQLNQGFLNSMATNNGGIILVEAISNTVAPLVLTIYHGTNVIAKTSLPLSITSIERMFRSKTMLLEPDSRAVEDRLTDAEVPNEPDTSNANFVFIHGYNVNPTQARGVAADMYKRMYWSGSHAKFWAVTWYGYDTQGSFGIPGLSDVTCDYHVNVDHAFNTASNLAVFLKSIPGGPITVNAHSLGNMLTLSALNDWNAPIANYFMMDAAVAIEAIDSSAAPQAGMIYSSWATTNNYASRLYASYWWNLFPTNDYRSGLNWNNRLGNFRNAQVYDFYSSGEEVLRENDNDPPVSQFNTLPNFAVYWHSNTPIASFMWAWQEKGKGVGLIDTILGSTHGGWKFNKNAPYYYTNNGVLTHMPNSQASVLPAAQLKTNAFFDTSYDYLLYNPPTGSAYAQLNGNRILSDAIPALTWPVGANPVPRLKPQNGNDRNIDMMTLENGWPAGRGKPQWPVGTAAFGEWHHSDFHEVAYTFTYHLFDQYVSLGNLK